MAETDGIYEEDISLPLPRWVRLRVIWKDGHPSPSELGVLRRLFPRLSHISLQSLSANPESSMTVGRETEPEAIRIQAVAQKEGVRLSIDDELELDQV